MSAEHQRTSAGAAELALRARAAVLACAGLFCACFLALGQPWLLHLFGAASLLIAAVLWRWVRAPLRVLLRPSARDIGAGLVLGVVSASLTYPLYEAAVELVPALAAETERLYAALRPGQAPGAALLWLPVVGVVEELLFRGALIEALGGERARWRAALLALALYTLGQAISQSAVVVLLGLGCGAIWTAARILTNGLWAPLVSHLVWSALLLALLPVVR